MKIVVCIKQIPDTNDVKWSKDNNIVRDGVISILNPRDLYGILTAREIENSEITILTMGPNDAIKSLRYCLALGGDKGILLSDKKFSGADTLATAKTLAHTIKNVIKDYDLIITGQYALDGDTAQTPYSLANLLNIPIIGYVNKLEVSGNEIFSTSIKDDGIYKFKGKTPLLLAISNFEGKMYTPLAKDYIDAQNKPIQILNQEDISIDPNEIGIKGSPTYVQKAFRPENNRTCKFIEASGLISEVE